MIYHLIGTQLVPYTESPTLTITLMAKTDTNKKSNIVKIIKTVVDAAQLPEGVDDYTYWDTQLKGFGLRLRRGADGVKKSYIVKYRNEVGKQRKPIIGTYPPMPPDDARKRASDMINAVQHGGDPSAEKQANRQGITMSELCDEYVTRHIRKHNKPSTQKRYESIIERVIKPSLGNMKVAAVEHNDVAKLHERMVDTPYEANRTLTLLSPMFVFAIKQKYRQKHSNPCEEIKQYPENKRERILTPEEREKLFAFLADQEKKQLENIYVTNILRLYCYTGCRATELLTLKWSYVNYEQKALFLPDSKTEWKSVTLNKIAASILQGIPKVEGNPYVFIGKNAGTHMVNISKPWDRIRKKLELDDVRLHDLRHTYASLLANTGASLHIIGEAIGSKTEPRRYSHLVNNTLEDAANKAAEAMLPSPPKAKPLPIKPRPKS